MWVPVVSQVFGVPNNRNHSCKVTKCLYSLFSSSVRGDPGFWESGGIGEAQHHVAVILSLLLVVKKLFIMGCQGSSVVHHLPSLCKALDSSITKIISFGDIKSKNVYFHYNSHLKFCLSLSLGLIILLFSSPNFFKILF